MNRASQINMVSYVMTILVIMAEVVILHMIWVFMRVIFIVF